MTMLKRHSETQNQESFENLYQQYYPRVYRYLCAHLKDNDDAADLTQQIFFQVWMHLPCYQPEKGSLATWILSIAHYRLIDFWRAHRTASSWETLYDITMTDYNPEDIVISAEMIAQVRALIDALSLAERELLALRFAARLSLAEIARIIGKSVEATKKQLSRLIRRLQERYRHLEEDARKSEPQGRQVLTFVAALSQVYQDSPARVRLTFRQESPLIKERII